MAKPTRLDYCQYLLTTRDNYTLTHYADHCERFSHDQINRYLAGNRLRPRLVWESVQPHLKQASNGYIIFDDTVLDKKYAQDIALAQKQYSGNAHGTINGIGVVTCVYVNPELDCYWIIDFRIYDKQGDGKSKLDHVQDMLDVLVNSRNVVFSTVLMDSWYATKVLMLFIENLGKKYYCPLRRNRLVDDSNGTKPYQHIDSLEWSKTEQKSGKRVKINKFPKNHKVKVFRVVSKKRTDYVATNDLNQSDVSAVRQVCSARWKIEQFHRETKQLTGIEKCQCRLARIVRNHITCAILVWICLMQKANEVGLSLYQVKNAPYSDFLRQQLKSPTLKMTNA